MNSDELRQLLWTALGQYICGFAAHGIEGNSDTSEAAKSGAFALIQFGVRGKLLTPDEASDLMGTLDDPVGWGKVFQKHGRMNESADGLIATFTKGGAEIVTTQIG